MGKRLSGEGSRPRRRKDGRWAASVVLEGRRRYVYAKTAAECGKKLRALIDLHERGALPADKKRTVGDELDLVLKAYTAKNRASSAHRKEQDAKRLASLRSIPLAKLTRPRVKRWLADLIDGGDSKDAANRALDLLKMVLREAVDDGWVVKNVAATLRRFDTEDERRHVDSYNAEELHALIEASESFRMGFFVQFISDSGARLGEGLGARFSQIDMETGRWHIDQQLVRHPHTGALSLGPLKTRRSQRSVLLTRATMRRMVAHRELLLSEGLGACDLVFPNADGTYYAHGNFRGRIWADIVDQADVRYFGPHALRHTCATLLLGRRIPLPEVARRLGDKPETILKTYAHAIPSMEAEVRDELEALFAAGGSR